MNTKNITVIPATGGRYSDLTIQPGTTPRDVKRQMGLDDSYMLTRGQGSETIPDDENLYETVAEGTKLYATTEATVAV